MFEGNFEGEKMSKKSRKQSRKKIAKKKLEIASPLLTKAASGDQKGGEAPKKASEASLAPQASPRPP